MTNNIRYIQKADKGFSLIELLVVISIIGILIGLSAFGLQGARQSARDARRIADIEQIRSGLELYKADCGVYPTADQMNGPLNPQGDLIGDNSSTACLNTNTYISNIPQDPHPGRVYVYQRLTPTTYEICAAMESRGSNLACNGMNPGWCPNAGMLCNYRVENP
jgi:general secretion pathway protein G